MQREHREDNKELEIKRIIKLGQEVKPTKQYTLKHMNNLFNGRVYCFFNLPSMYYRLRPKFVIKTSI